MKINVGIIGLGYWGPNLVRNFCAVQESKVITCWDIEGLYEAMVQYRSGDMYAPATPRTEALAREVKHFLHCVRNGQRPLTDGWAGLRVVQILAAAHESLKNEGRRVEPNLQSRESLTANRSLTTGVFREAVKD